MNRGQRNRRQQQEAKVTGLTAGEPDVRVYLSEGRLVSFELKTPDGSRSKAQKARHARLAALGHVVETVAAKTPEAMADAIEARVRAILG